MILFLTMLASLGLRHSPKCHNNIIAQYCRLLYKNNKIVKNLAVHIALLWRMHPFSIRIFI